jgi:hypothetical protein
MVAKKLVAIVLIVLDAGLSARRQVLRRSGGGRAGVWHLHARRRGPPRRRGVVVVPQTETLGGGAERKSMADNGVAASWGTAERGAGIALKR